MEMIKIGDWHYPRRVGYSTSRDRVCIEIKMLLCADCNSCLKRHNDVLRRIEFLALSDVLWEQDGRILSLPNPNLLTEADQLAFLTDLFGVPVRRVDTVVV